MLPEIALSPAIFRSDAYASSSIADVCLGTMYRPLLEECVVRNLQRGAWSQFTSSQSALHIKARELLKKLAAKNRLIIHDFSTGNTPHTDEEWENEAIASYQQDGLAGLIFDSQAKEQRHKENPLVSCPERLHSTPFWRDRPCSCRVSRTVTEYRKVIDPLLRCANSLAFIDPHLDPEKPQYRDFLQILLHPVLLGRSIRPTIEIHRVAWRGNGNDLRPVVQELQSVFSTNWSRPLRENGLKLEVFLWDKFHDRFLATNLVAMSWSNGFDTTSDQSARVTISRIDRADLDSLQKEFDQNSAVHKLVNRFTIG